MAARVAPQVRGLASHFFLGMYMFYYGFENVQHKWFMVVEDQDTGRSWEPDIEGRMMHPRVSGQHHSHSFGWLHELMPCNCIIKLVWNRV